MSACPVREAHPGREEHQDCKAHKVHLETVVRQVHLALEGNADYPAHLDFLEFQVAWYPRRKYVP